MIPEDHPLQKLFLELVARHYAEEIGIRDPELIGYVAHLLTEFCDSEQLFRIRNSAGKPLMDVGDVATFLARLKLLRLTLLLLVGRAEIRRGGVTKRGVQPVVERHARATRSSLGPLPDGWIDAVNTPRYARIHALVRFRHWRFLRLQPPRASHRRDNRISRRSSASDPDFFALR